MIFSPLNRKPNLHSHSNSLPSSLHPLIPQIDEHLARLISSSEATTSSSQISKNLSGLKDMYELVNDLLQLPHAEQALSHQCQDDEALGGSLRLLDACGMPKDALLQAKANTQERQSTLRRRGNEVKFVHEVKEYLASRKDAKKSINKFMRNLKSNCGLTPLESDTEATRRMLREVEGVTLSILESLLSHISGPKMQPNSLISKLLHTKRIACEEVASSNNEFAKMDAASHSNWSEDEKG